LGSEAEGACGEASVDSGQPEDRACAEAAERLEPGDGRAGDDDAAYEGSQLGVCREGREDRGAACGVADEERGRAVIVGGGAECGGEVLSCPVVEDPPLSRLGSLAQAVAAGVEDPGGVAVLRESACEAGAAGPEPEGVIGECAGHEEDRRR